MLGWVRDGEVDVFVGMDWGWGWGGDKIEDEGLSSRLTVQDVHVAGFAGGFVESR